MELTSLMAARMVLCVGFVTKAVLMITHLQSIRGGVSLTSPCSGLVQANITEVTRVKSGQSWIWR